MDFIDPNSFNGTSGCISWRACQPKNTREMVKKATCSAHWTGCCENVGFIPALRVNVEYSESDATLPLTNDSSPANGHSRGIDPCVPRIRPQRGRT